MQEIVSTQDDNYDKSQLFTVCPYADGRGYYNLDLSVIKNKKEFIIRSLLVLAGTANKEVYDEYRPEPMQPVSGIRLAPNGPKITGGGEIEDFILDGQEQSFFTTTKRGERVFENRIVGCLFTALFYSECIDGKHYTNNPAYMMPENFEKNKAELRHIGKDVLLEERYRINTTSQEEETVNDFKPTGVADLNFGRIYDKYYALALSFYKSTGDTQMVRTLQIIDEARRNNKVKKIKDAFEKKNISFETISKGDMFFRIAKIEDIQNPANTKQRLVELGVAGVGMIPYDRIKNCNNSIIEFTDEEDNNVFKVSKPNCFIQGSKDGYGLFAGGVPLKQGGKRDNIDFQDCIKWADGSYMCVSGEHTGQYCIFKEAPEIKLKPDDAYVKNLKYCTIGTVNKEGDLIQVEGFLDRSASCFNFGPKGPFVKFVKMRVNGEEISLKDEKDKFLKYYRSFVSALSSGISVKKDKEVGEMLQKFGNLEIDERFTLAKLAVLDKQLTSEKEDDFVKEQKKKAKEKEEKEKKIKRLEEQKKKRLQDLASGKLQQQIDKANNDIRARNGLRLDYECQQAINEIAKQINGAPSLKSIDSIELSLFDKILDVFRSAFGFKTKKQKMEEKIMTDNMNKKRVWDNYVKTSLTKKANAASFIRQALNGGRIQVSTLPDINANLIKFNLDPIQPPASQLDEPQTNLNSTRRRSRRR